MAFRMKLRRGPWIPVAVLVAIWVGAGSYARATYEPLEAVIEVAEQQGFERGELSPREGGYEAGLISWTAHRTFLHEPTGDLIEIEIARPTPFHSWRLTHLERQPR